MFLLTLFIRRIYMYTLYINNDWNLSTDYTPGSGQAVTGLHLSPSTEAGPLNIYHVGSEVLRAVVMPCSPLKANHRFRRTCPQYVLCIGISQARNPHEAGSTLVSCLAYSLTLKTEASCSTEMSVDFQRTIRHYIPERRISPYLHISQELISTARNKNN
jgi:hypothetical protein